MLQTTAWLGLNSLFYEDTGTVRPGLCVSNDNGSLVEKGKQFVPRLLFQKKVH